MTLAEFEAKAQEVGFVDVLSKTIELACNSLDFDLRCIDWFASSPEVADFYIEQKNRMAA